MKHRMWFDQHRHLLQQKFISGCQSPASDTGVSHEEAVERVARPAKLAKLGFGSASATTSPV